MGNNLSKSDQETVIKYLARNIFAKSYGIDDKNLNDITTTLMVPMDWINKHGFEIPGLPDITSKLSDSDFRQIQTTLAKIVDTYSAVIRFEAPSSLSKSEFNPLIEVQAMNNLKLLCGEMLQNNDYKADYIGSFLLGDAHAKQPDTYKLSVPIDFRAPKAHLILEGIISADAKGLTETQDVFNALDGKK